MTEEFLLRELPQINRIKNTMLREKCLSTWNAACDAGAQTEESLLQHKAHKRLIGCQITLLEHTRGVTEIAIKLAEQMQKDFGTLVNFDFDIIVVGALLHDIGKVLENEEANEEAHQFIRHPLSGAILADQCGCPWQVVHIIANHSWEGHKAVDTPELYIVRSADDFYYRFLLFKYSNKG